MKKKILLFVLSVLPVLASADAIEIDGIFYNLITKGYVAEVTKNPNEYVGNVIIPDSVVYEGNTYAVKKIGESAFKLCFKLTSVTIPNSIESIGNDSFEDCWTLNSISIGENVVSIGKKAFTNCKELTSVTIPNSVSSIGYSAFWGCKGLTSVVMSNSITTISSGEFEKCTSLTSFIIPDAVTYVSNDAFRECTNLKSIIIPNNVKTIGNSAFEGCSQLTSITIGEAVEVIANKTFSNCIELKDVFCLAKQIPQTVSDSFKDSYIEYATLHVPQKLISLYSQVEPWKNFGNIVKIDMPQHNLIYMVDGEIYKTCSIEEGEDITPEPAPTKEGYTFSGWSEIPETMPAKDVTVTGTFTINKYKLKYMVDGEEYKSYDVEYGATITPEPAPTKEGYTFSGWSETPETMPANDVTVTGTFTINKYKLTYMVDNEEYKSYDIEYGATITPEPAPTKDGYTFSGWSDIPKTMPAENVTVTGSFTAIVIEEEEGDFVATSENSAEMTGDDNVSGNYAIPETVTQDGVEYTVTSIGDNAFKDNTALTDITLPATITEIKSGAFAGCVNLKTITVYNETPIALPATSRTRSGGSVFDGVDLNTCILYVPEGSVDSYRAAAVWGEFTNILAIGSSGINYVIHDGKSFDVYNLQGRKVKANTKSLDGLPKGIYIINGKKILR